MRRLGIVVVALVFVLVAGSLLVLDLRRVVPLLQCRCPSIRPLVVGKAFVDNPAWSPDGAWIAFEKARVAQSVVYVTSEIYLAKPDGGRVWRLTNDNAEDTHPTWSPDGRSLAFASRLDFPMNQADYISRMDVESGQASVMFTCPRRCKDPTWSPDGRWLAFQMRVAERVLSSWDIWLLNAATSQAQLFTTVASYSEGLAWSPDSGRLLFIRDRSIVSRPIDGSGQEEALPLGSDVTSPAWSRAGDVFAFARDDTVTTQGGQDRIRRVYVSSRDGTAPSLLLDEPVEGWMYSPAMSPDGKTLAFTYDSRWLWRELYVADLSQP